jgi:hypothetical protein
MSAIHTFRKVTLAALVLPVLIGCSESTPASATDPKPKAAATQPSKPAAPRKPKATLLKDRKADGYFRPSFEGGFLMDHLIEYRGGDALDRLSRECGCEVFLRYHGPTRAQGMKSGFVIHELIFHVRGKLPREWSARLYGALDKLALKDRKGTVHRPSHRFLFGGREGQINVSNVGKDDPHFKPGMLVFPTPKMQNRVFFFFILPREEVPMPTIALPGGDVRVDILELFKDPVEKP